jgi:serine/threonine-protein kinase/endoribonuclease IRE1
LTQANDFLQDITRTRPELLRLFEEYQKEIVGDNWIKVVHPSIMLDAVRRSNYGNTITDLVKLIRNKHSHRATDEDGKFVTVLGHTPDDYFEYFHRKFPNLFLYTYYFVEKYNRP